MYIYDCCRFKVTKLLSRRILLNALDPSIIYRFNYHTKNTRTQIHFIKMFERLVVRLQNEWNGWNHQLNFGFFTYINVQFGACSQNRTVRNFILLNVVYSFLFFSPNLTCRHWYLFAFCFYFYHHLLFVGWHGLIKQLPLSLLFWNVCQQKWNTINI